MTKDRVGTDQVEATSVEREFPAPPNPAHAAQFMERARPAEAAHAEMKHDEHAGHGADMAHDLLGRFIVSIILSIPIVLFSPFGRIIGLSGMPPFGIPLNVFGFLLTTPVVWWGGWPFISAAWRALRRGEANMMTLIALGILVSYEEVYLPLADYLALSLTQGLKS